MLPEDTAEDFAEEGIVPNRHLRGHHVERRRGFRPEPLLLGSSQATTNFKVTRAVKGHIEKIASGDNNMAVLLDDGTITVLGDKSSEYYSNVPEELQDGSVRVVDIASTNRNVLALDDEGNIYTWGSSQDGLTKVPEFTGEVKAVEAAISTSSSCWTTAPWSPGAPTSWARRICPRTWGPVTQIFSDYFQSYALGEDGTIYAWGNKGYFLGSDEFGRDMLGRLIHGGRNLPDRRRHRHADLHHDRPDRGALRPATSAAGWTTC